MRRISLLLAVVLAVAAAACGGGDDLEASGKPVVVVTTSILGDVVENLTGGAVDVNVLMPAGADPHQFQLSARQVADVGEADALVVNGGGFEAGMLDVIESARGDGVPVVTALDAVVTPDHDDDHDGHDHDDHDGHDHYDHDHDGVDPHFFTDPVSMSLAVRHIAEQLEGEVGIDVADTAAAYADRLLDLADEVTELLAPIPDADRVLVTTHDVLGYFADANGFRVIGTVIPSASTSDAASADALAELAATIEAEGVPAVFVDTTSASGLAETLAREVGEVEVVPLFTESLGPVESGPDDSDGATYIDMIRTNARRIAEALT